MMRYDRQIKLNEVGDSGQEKLHDASVLIVGVGGLGCPAAQYLTGAGVGKIGLMDHDRVSLSNLHRQTLFSEADIGKSKASVAKEKLEQLNSEIELYAIEEALTIENAEKLFNKYDIILDGTDNFETKYLINDACILTGKPWVYASIFKNEGQLSVFNFQNGPSYRCLFPKTTGQNDELAEEMGKDPIQFRLDMLKRAEKDPVGEENDYDAARYAGVLKMARDKSGWDNSSSGLNRGVSAYYCHNSYVAQILDLTVKNNEPIIDKVTCAVDCGIVVNPDAAKNMVEGGTIDGIGHALYSEMTFEEGKPQKSNFDNYRLIRHREAPKVVDVYFVKNGIDPTGLGEPPFPPVQGALANALYKATGKRFYKQPFINQLQTVETELKT